MATDKKLIKKAQNGDAVTKSVKSYIGLQAKRANRKKNELTTGDLHTDNQANNKSTPESRLGSRATYNLKKIFEKEKAPDKVLSAISKKKNGGSVKAKDGKWMQKAAASIKKRGTEGKCTPITKPGCTGKAKTLAKTFKKIAKSNKKK
jgi:hypothetical protein